MLPTFITFNCIYYCLCTNSVSEVTSKWAHVLFDWGGCTAIVETKRLVGEEPKEVGSRYKLSFDGKMHNVEILGFGSK